VFLFLKFIPYFVTSLRCYVIHTFFFDTQKLQKMHELALLCLSGCLSVCPSVQPSIHLSMYGNSKMGEQIFVRFLTGEFPKSYTYFSFGYCETVVTLLHVLWTGFGEKCSTFSKNLMVCEIKKQKVVKTPEMLGCINFLTNYNRKLTSAGSFVTKVWKTQQHTQCMKRPGCHLWHGW